MPANRYFFPRDFTPTITMDNKEELHHCRRVLRAKVGDSVELINGRGALAHGTFSHITHDAALIAIRHVEQSTRPPWNVTLCLALLKPAHLEYAIEKAVEVGVSSFELFVGELSEKKAVSTTYLRRLQDIIKNACKQCGRLFLPELFLKETLSSCLNNTHEAIFFGETLPTPQPIIPKKHLRLFIGPESGFSEKEKKTLLEHQATPLSLHPHTLRAETAAIVGTYFLFQALYA